MKIYLFIKDSYVSVVKFVIMGYYQNASIPCDFILSYPHLTNLVVLFLKLGLALKLAVIQLIMLVYTNVIAYVKV